ncbi:MAG: type III-A CRISPR-associated RAMP protein Csm4, partial [Candidatus Methanofastidiosa archaeon]|nr:type III-A CRISPR-associated RAMP protein Csm4 [Candidatus Methanofastidiosa archaeon]
MKAIRLTLSKMHVGRSSVLQEIDDFVHSDTLFSAICSAWLRLYGVNDMTASLLASADNPPLRISSCFPYCKETYYFPKLALPVEVPEDVRKQYKSQHFLPQDIFESLLHGIVPTKELEAYLSSGKALRHGTEYTYPRVALDRIDNTSELYESSDYWLADDAGLFFLYECVPQLEGKLDAVLHVLGDEGIGGKRSIGRGQFVPHKATVSLSLPEHPNRYTSLALYYPAAEEQLSPDDSYALIERGG